MQILNAISIDVEDYFQTEACSLAVTRDAWPTMPSRVEANTERLLQILQEFGVTATFFFLGWVAERFPGLVRTVVDLGHEIGCHSYWHRPVYGLSPPEFREDTLRAKRVIEDAAGIPVYGYRAPSFSMVPGTEWASGILAELGFRYDSSVNPIHHDLYSNASANPLPHAIANQRLLELPIATVKFFSVNLPIGGGGYLRMLPYWYIAKGIERLNERQRRPAMLYLHPWELDGEQPRQKLGFKSSLRQYTGLKGMELKLRRLLAEFKFSTATRAFAAEFEKATIEKEQSLASTNTAYANA